MRMPVVSVVAVVMFFALVPAQGEIVAPEHSDGTSLDLQVIASLPSMSVQVFYETLSPQEKADIWTAHLKEFLASHPDLTAEQRDVILEALGLIALDVFEVQPHDSAWEWTRAALDRLTMRGRTLLPFATAKAALVDLGYPSSDISGGLTAADDDKIDCTCSTASDWCDMFTNVNDTCVAGFLECTILMRGCGTLWLYACDGFCWTDE